MSDHRHDAHDEREQNLQHAFDDAAPDLDLELVEADDGEAVTVGVLVGLQDAPKCVTVDDTAAEPADHTDDQEIKDLVETWESVPYANLADTWADNATDPFLLVGHDAVHQVDRSALQAGMSTPQWQAFQQKYPEKSPRAVKVTQVDIHYLGKRDSQHPVRRASVHFRVRETFDNGVKTDDHCSMVVYRHDGAWKVASATKRDLHEKDPVDGGAT